MEFDSWVSYSSHDFHSQDTHRVRSGESVLGRREISNWAFLSIKLQSLVFLSSVFLITLILEFMCTSCLDLHLLYGLGTPQTLYLVIL